MRKILFLSMAILLLFSLMLEACTSISDTSSTPTSIPIPIKTLLSIPDPSPTSMLTATPLTTPTSSSKEIELKYDDGKVDGFCSAGGTIFRVKFTPPTPIFKINKIKLYTRLQGSGYEAQKVEVTIISSELDLLFDQQKPASEFSVQPDWVSINTPDIVVTSNFFVDFYLNSKKEGGVYIAYDLSTINQYSEYLTQSGEAPWPFSSPKDKTNWMIRVIGEPIDTVPPATTKPLKIIESTPEFQNLVNSLNTPEKLSEWMIQNIKSESYYEREKATGVRYTPPPDETFKTRSGNCRVFSLFACYFLQYHGYEAEILGIMVASDESKNHAVCVYHINNLLYVINNGRMQGPYKSYEEIATSHHEGWSSYQIHRTWDRYQAMSLPDKVVYRK